MSEKKVVIRMLVVEDDEDIAVALRDFFEMQGLVVSVASDGEKAIEVVKETLSYDIILLDIMLPKKNGFEVLRDCREMGLKSPVLMLTGRGEQENVLRGFDLGATDYVTKPFSVEELAGRVRAILSRTMAPSQAPMDIYQIGDVKVNFSTNEVFRGNDRVHFTVMEFDLLRYLLQNKGQTISRKELLSAVWRIDQDIVTRTIDRHMASLRQKLEPDPSDPVFIKTVYGRGYRFEA